MKIPTLEERIQVRTSEIVITHIQSLNNLLS
jgi:hypothetical protein